VARASVVLPERQLGATPPQVAVPFARRETCPVSDRLCGMMLEHPPRFLGA